jgi:hypothetical protein
MPPGAQPRVEKKRMLSGALVDDREKLWVHAHPNYIPASSQRLFVIKSVKTSQEGYEIRDVSLWHSELLALMSIETNILLARRDVEQ